MSKQIDINNLKQQRGSVAVVILVIVAIAAIGGLAFFSGKLAGTPNNNESSMQANNTVPAAGDSNTAAAPEATETASGDAQTATPPMEIKPGNPVVARVNGQNIERVEVLNTMQNLPLQMRQMPLDQLFPIALDQVVNSKLIDAKTEGVNLEGNPEVEQQVEQAREQIEKTVYLQNMVNERLTEDKIQQKYDEIVANTPNEEEVRASHILVEDEATAKEVIQKLQETGDFAGLAKEYSKDATKDNGGQLGYFLRSEVVEPFANAAFGMEPGVYTSEPVKTEFGYHVIRVEDKRMRTAPPLEEAKPFIEANLRREILEQIINEWREGADIQTFGINGDPSASAEVPAP